MGIGIREEEEEMIFGFSLTRNDDLSVFHSQLMVTNFVIRLQIRRPYLKRNVETVPFYVFYQESGSQFGSNELIENAFREMLSKNASIIINTHHHKIHLMLLFQDFAGLSHFAHLYPFSSYAPMEGGRCMHICCGFHLRHGVYLANACDFARKSQTIACIHSKNGA